MLCVLFRWSSRNQNPQGRNEEKEVGKTHPSLKHPIQTYLVRGLIEPPIYYTARRHSYQKAISTAYAVAIWSLHMAAPVYGTHIYSLQGAKAQM
jgi:hypothetical protein